ncbi:DUF7144 family membrane protein [Streptomyces sp. F001]|nr:hypothetical protein StrepF001_31810 [Streptomyces sp. F001]
MHTARTPTPWTRRTFFAAVMLLVIGAFNLIEGLAALFRDVVFADTGSGVLVFDLSSWGWIHLIIGVLQILTGIGLMTGQAWARPVAITLVVLNLIAQMLFFTVYPLWAMLIVALDVFVLWTLMVHSLEDARKAS